MAMMQHAPETVSMEPLSTEAEEASASMALLCPDTRGRAPCEEIVELSGIRGYFVTPAQKRIPGRFLIADFLEINLSLAKERFSLDFVTAAGIPRTRTSFFGETCNARLSLNGTHFGKTSIFPREGRTRTMMPWHRSSSETPRGRRNANNGT